MKYGYARVSTLDQNLNAQLDALNKAGCDEIYMEKMSGKSMDRPELKNLLAKIKAGDTLIVTKLDRLGRSLTELIELTDRFKDDGIEFVSLSEKIDTSTATGKMYFQIIGVFAEFERNLLRERIKEGFEAAKKRGVKFGRKPTSEETLQQIRRLKADGYKPKEIAKFTNIGISTFYKLQKDGLV